MANYSTYRQQTYDYGLVNSSSRRETPRGGASVLENWDITYKGRLTTRDGLTTYGDALSNIPLSLGHYRKDNGTSYLLTIEGTNLKYLNGATWTNIDTSMTNEKISFQDIDVSDKIYGSSENNPIFHWDGTTYTELAASIPHGNKLIWYQNHMITLNNVNISGTIYKNRAYISNFGDPNTWTTGTDFIQMQGFGDAVTAEILGDVLVLFKDRSYSILSGYGISSWVLSGSVNPIQNIDSSVGCPSVRGVVRVSQNELWFIDQNGQIRRLSATDYGYSSKVMSNNIQGTIDTINTTKLSEAVAWYDNEKVYFAVPTGVSTENNTVLVYDMKAHSRTGKEAWTTYTGWLVSDMLSFPVSSDPEMIVAGGSNDKVYRHTGTDDAGVNISCRWDSGSDDYDKPEKYKKHAYGYINALNQGDSNVTIHASLDGTSFAKIGTFNLLGSGDTLGPTGGATMGPTGSFVLGGSEDVEYKYYFYDGGGAITSKTVIMSIRYSGDQAVSVNTFTNHFSERSLK